MRFSFDRLIICCARAAPFAVSLVFAVSQLACEKPVTGDPFVGVAGTVITDDKLTPVESASVRLVTDRVDLLQSTDEAGEFNFTVIGNSILKNAVVIVKKSGYITLDSVFGHIEGESASELIFELEPLK